MDVAQPHGAPLAARLASVVTPAAPGEPNQQVVGESLFGAFMFTMMAPELYARAPRNASGNLDRQTMTQEMTTSDGSTIRLTLQPSLAGSKLNAEVNVEISVPGPPAYTEHATGTLTVDLCPDASGAVPLQLTLGGGFSILGGGMQYHVAVTATGHTDDSGKLASMDVQADGSMASQPLTGQGALGTAPMYVELRTGYSVGLGAGGAVSNASGSAPRYSSQVDAAFVRSAIAMTASMGSIATVLGFQSAEKQWTSGYCLEIAVPSMGAGGSQTVATGSTTPFTANVRHKFEGNDLVVPVTATLGSGGVSVSPSGSPVTAPATFQYKAPDQDRQTAKVDLETHSKRGIATLAVTFTTGTSAYTVDGTYFGVYHLTGTICDLTNAFKLTADAAQIVAKGVFLFEPAGADGGTWSYKGKMGPAGGALAYKGSGAYTVVRPAGGATDAVPVLRMAGGTDWTVTAPIAGTFPLGEGAHLGPGDDVTLVPAPACPG